MLGTDRDPLQSSGVSQRKFGRLAWLGSHPPRLPGSEREGEACDRPTANLLPAILNQ